MLKIPLSDSTFRDMRDYIYDKSGIFITDTKKYLIENRLLRILQENKINSYEDYYSIIKSNSSSKEINRLLDAITTNETYFFREPDHFEALTGELVPKILSLKKDPKKIRIWSAACSTGEEPYTLSMIMLEKLISPKMFEIYATDISAGVLNSAKNAVYNSYSVRNIPEPYMKNYFSNSNEAYSLSPSIKNSVAFSNANITDSSNLKQFRGMDIIFCRNVLIYFDLKAKQKAVSNLYDCLNTGGYLFVGCSESLHNVTRAFRPNVINRVIAYQKV